MEERPADGRADRRTGRRVVPGMFLTAGGLLAVLACGDATGSGDKALPRPLDPDLVAEGKDIFRHETFGNEVFWTDTARMHEVIATSVSPALALAVGLNVDADALPQPVKDAIAAGQVDLDDPATTVTLLKLNAVLGLHGTVETAGGRDTLVRVGITCALCHSRVDNSFAPGIGARQDGWASSDLNVGAIVALSPAIPEELKAIMRGWGPGRYDPRTNRDGLNTPIVIPPAYGLHGVAKETYTGEGPVSYWNAYVAVTQMHGLGTFRDPRLGIDVSANPDLVTAKLPALAEYQFSLAAPRAPGAHGWSRRGPGPGSVQWAGSLFQLSSPRTAVHRCRLGSATLAQRNRHGPCLRGAHRHQAVPHHPLTGVVAACTVFPRRQRRNAGGGGRALRRHARSKPLGATEG